ncbi:polysaccharide lyase family 8 super-sandwich domain-containing protein [Pedobacter arcticus]|uniref:polysaccharide lyase family 8 super-sandwich domain-containing protein n=1 Tax=Pedobacter arcticus TaxID=752140 RepID=UPI0002ED4D02|nr:polysaccharide lyase family 8 super-sandwich domain-containing protein [Pedobacter arcticus]
MKLYLSVALCLITGFAAAQQRYVDFNSSIPSNWSTSGATPLALSDEHLKDGAKALKWVAAANNELRAIDLNIPLTEIASTSTGSAQIFVYSKEVSNDTLYFTFFDQNNVQRRQGKMLLNFKGWRDYHRSYYYDYAVNNGTVAGFLLKKCVVTYKPVHPTAVKTIYLDSVKFIGDDAVRIPGPHMAIDYPFFRQQAVNGQNGNALTSFLNVPNIPVTLPSAQELTDLNVVRSRLARTLATVSSTDLAEAKAYVNFSNIRYNPDNTITGRGISDIYDADTLVRLANYCGYLARAYRQNTDEDAKVKLIDFTKYLLDQGFAEGGRSVLRTNSYANPLALPLGFIDALPVYPVDVRSDVMKMLKWSNMFGIVHENTYIPGYNVDFLYLKGKFLPELAVLEQDDALAVRDLKAVKRFLERNTESSYGARDGIKPDAMGFHHQSHHVSYMYAWGEWTNIVYNLKGTSFKVSKQAYDNMVFAMKNLFIGTSKGTLFAHAESGRTPFQSSVSVKLTQLKSLIEIGGDIMGEPIDPALASFYNNLTGTNAYSAPAVNYDGFYPYAYGPMAVKRKGNYVAVMRGSTDKLFGSEINAGDNRWGRYQSYGSLEILYGGNLSSSGYILYGNGWDWNMMPGTTTVHFPTYTGLLALKPTSTEFQKNSFAGGLSLGDQGIFALDFSQDAKTYYTSSDLTFKKSVFAFDDIMLCLGTNITTSNALGDVATNLFQAVTTGSNPAIYVNSTTPVSGALNTTISTASASAWLLTAQKTGFYIPKGNGDISVFRGSQSTPLESSDDETVTATANASKAWISHGTKPSDGKYAYVVVPDVTPSAMQAVISQIDSGVVYEILEQSNTAHVVKYLPKKLTSYVFFDPKTDVNIGYIKSISNKALVGAREALSSNKLIDSLIVTINIPDLNTENKTSWDYYWLARPSTVSITLKGGWDIDENTNNASITKNGDELTATFVLEHGFSNTIKLVREAVLHEPGKWVLESDSLNYDLGAGTGNQGSNWSTGVSISTSANPGFLPYPTKGMARVGSASGAPSFDLEGTGETAALKITASSAGTIGKFSVYGTDASAVTALFFRMTFNTEPTNGTWVMAMGNHLESSDNVNRFNDGSGLPNTERAEVFTALKWTIGTANELVFSYRQRSGSSISYPILNNAPFVKGGTYDVEVYANNHDASQDYVRGSKTYTVDAGMLDFWVDGIKLGVFAASELERKKELSAFLFTGNASTLPTSNAAQLTLSNIQLQYVKPTLLPLTITSFTGDYSQGDVLLKWSTVFEKNVDLFKIYSSTDGQNYNLIGSVNATGDSEKKVQYTFTDAQFSTNQPHIYYKMIAVDKDGTQSYESDVVAIKLPLKSEPFSIMPNPVSDKMELRFYSKFDTQAEIRIVSIDGKVVQSRSTFVKTGYNILTLDASYLAPAVYITTVNGTSLYEKGTFIKK